MNFLGYEHSFSSLLRAFCAIAIGLVMIVSTNATVTLVRIIAAFLFAAGVISFIYGIAKKQSDTIILMSTNAIVDMVAGLVLFFFPMQIAGFIVSIIGIVLLIMGLMQLLTLIGTLSLVGLGFFPILLSLAALIGGIVLIFNPFTEIIMSKFAGAFLIIYGISELASNKKVEEAKRAYNIKFTKTKDGQKGHREKVDTSNIDDAKEVEYRKSND